MMTFSSLIARRCGSDRRGRSIRTVLACTIALIICTSAVKESSQSAYALDDDSAADVADVPAEDLRARKDDNKRYFLIGPKDDKGAPEAGRGLIIVMPGGGGSADFHPFVKRVFKNAVPEGYRVAQPVAINWTAGQKIVWLEKNSPPRTGDNPLPIN